MEKSKR